MAGKITDMTALSAALDLDELVEITDDPSGTPVTRSIPIRRFAFGRPQIPYFTDASVYLGAPVGDLVASGTGHTSIANQLYMHPIIVPYRRAFTTMAISCQTLQASSHVRCGLFNAHQVTGKPTTLIEEIGTPFDTATTGVKTGGITQTLEPGFYWAGLLADTAGIVIRGFTSGDCNILGFRPLTTSLDPFGHLFRALAYGALGDESASTWSLGVNVSCPMALMR